MPANFASSEPCSAPDFATGVVVAASMVFAVLRFGVMGTTVAELFTTLALVLPTVRVVACGLAAVFRPPRV